MTTPTHPTTIHLRKAATQLRRANRTSKDDHREIIELAETLAALTVVVGCLPAISDHLRSVVSKADADFYTYDDRSLTAEEAFNLIETCLNAAVAHLDDTATALVESWSVLLHVRIHDPDAAELA
jgi:chemotaxis regulatin CheY-phosphate phosphatase CheZ